MSGLGRGIRVTLIGWALLVVFAVLVLVGGLHAVEQVAYLVAAATADDLDAALLIGDLFGLAAGLLIVVGSVLALRSRRSTTVRREASLI